MFTIYLAGFICGNKLDECVEWRKRIVQHYKLKSWEDIRWLDPMNGQAVSTITPEGLKSDIPGKGLYARDVDAVLASDLIIANLNTFGESRSPTGTICEIAIAGWNHKNVIVITDHMNFKEHPFIKELSSIIVPSVDKLLEDKIIDYFYKGKVTARYE